MLLRPASICRAAVSACPRRPPRPPSAGSFATTVALGGSLVDGSQTRPAGLRPQAQARARARPDGSPLPGRPVAPGRRAVVAAASHSGAEPPHLLLVDAMPWVYRAHYGYRNRLHNAAGTDTTVMYGFFSSLLSMMEMQPPVTHMAVVFDAPGLTFRHEMFSGYKGNRSPTPVEIVEALPQIDRMLCSMGLAVLREPGVEADDVIGTIAERTKDGGALVSIATIDKDFKQLVGTRLRLVQPCKEPKGTLQVYSLREFHDEFGGSISPLQFRDVLALAGDSADNVPGVKRVGIKTALALISQYGSVEGVLENAEQTKPKGARENLCSLEGAASARLSLELVQIRTALAKPSTQLPLDNLLVPPTLSMAAGVEADWAEMEFQSLMARLKSRAA